MDNKDQKIDLSLWNSIRKGDRTAFDAFYYEHIDSMYTYGSTLVLNNNALEDHIQNLFKTLWEKRKSIRIDKNPKAYVLTMLRRQVFSSKSQFEEVQLNESDFVSSIMSPEDILINREDQDIRQYNLEYLKNQLSSRQKEAIHLKFYEEFSNDDISHIMGIEVNGVYKLVHTGLKAMRQKL